MEVIRNNAVVAPSEERTAECEACGSILKVASGDVSYGAYGCAYFTCPCCGKRSYIDGWELELTPDTTDFPQHYYHTAAPSARHVENTEIERMVKEAVNELEKLGSHNDYIIGGCGDAWMFVRYGESHDEIEVFVARDFYETTMKRE